MATISKVGIVTVTYNSSGVLREFMRCILAQSHRDFILVLVDNNSSDDSTSILGSYADERIVVVRNETNRGVAAGNNQGIRKAMQLRCDRVLLINNDVEFGPRLLTDLVQAGENAGADIVVPKIYYWDKPKVLWYAGGSFCWPRPYPVAHRGANELDRGQFDRVEQVDYSPTCCMLLASAVFTHIGLMDEQYFAYCDDTDFCFRARKAGFSIYYVPGVTLFHKVSSLTGKDSEFSRRLNTRNCVYFLRKHHRRGSTLVRLAFLQTYFLLRFLLGKETLGDFGSRQRWFLEGCRLKTNNEPAPLPD